MAVENGQQHRQAELIDIEAIPENYEKLKSYNYRINYQVNNLDTLLILSTFEEIDNSFTYSIYYPSKVPFKAISSFKINENKYHVNIFDTTGNLFAEGYSSQLIHEFRGLYRDDFLLFDFDSSFQLNDATFFMSINHILPEGKWTFYHPKGHQKMTVFFEKIIQQDLKLNRLIFNDAQPYKPAGTSGGNVARND